MGVADAGRPAKPGAGSPETLLNFWRYLGFEEDTLADGDTIGGSAAERFEALREHELFPYAVWGLVAFAAVAVAALLSALASERANSAKAPIELTQLRTSANDVARLQETIDKLLLEQQRLARRVEDFERTQSDLTATTPVDHKNVVWGPPPYPFGLKVKQKGTSVAEARDRPLPVEVRDPVPVPPAPVPAEKEAIAPPVPPVPPAPPRAAVPLPPLPPLEKETTVVPPGIAERDTMLQLPPPLTEKDVGLLQLPAARVAETPRIMETPREPEPLRTTATPRPVETPRPAEPPRAAETPRPPETPRAVEAPRAVETARVETPRAAEKPVPETTQAVVTRTQFALDLGGEMTLDGLRARWANLRGNHGQVLDNLKPLVALREADQPGAFDFRLLVGPIANAADAARICARLNTTKIICAVTTFDGQHLALR